MAFLFKVKGWAPAAAGHGRFAHVPFLLSSDMAYLDEANRFLRERAAGAWHPSRRAETPQGKARLPSENTIGAYARDLENAWTYFEAHDLDRRTVTYQDLQTYDTRMGTGRWSADGQRLGDNTINRRVDTAVEFLSWAGDRGIQPVFEVITELSARSGRAGGRHRSSEVRVGRRRVHPRHLRLPTAAEVRKWLAEVAARRGKTKALMCRTILETGMRIEETALLR